MRLVGDLDRSERLFCLSGFVRSARAGESRLVARSCPAPGGASVQKLCVRPAHDRAYGT